MKVLVARTDRLGDVVLSLPALDLLAAARPRWELHALVAPAAVPLVEHHPAVRRVWTWPPRSEPGATGDLARDLRRAGFDAALLLRYRWRLGLVIRGAGIPLRAGPLSQWTSWLLLNRGVRQARSRRDGHETDLGCQLAARIAGVDATPSSPPRLHPGAEQRAAGEEFRRRRAPDAATMCFLHPGSGGSGLDWPPDRFAAVANELAARPGWKVFVTGAGRDAAVVAAVASLADPGVEIMLDAADLRGFLGILAAGDVLVGPSTGPLHMAAALDLATVGIYPPVRTLGPGRWGPRGRWAHALVPAAECPARRHCLRGRCEHWNCMEGIAPPAVAAAAADLARRRADESAAQMPPGREETSS